MKKTKGKGPIKGITVKKRKVSQSKNPFSIVKDSDTSDRYLLKLKRANGGEVTLMDLMIHNPGRDKSFFGAHIYFSPNYCIYKRIPDDMNSFIMF